METALYPMKCLPLYKNVIWGGNKLKDYGFDYDPLPNCGELWVDGGIRSRHDMAVAAAYGVSTVLEGRPFITALCRERA